MSGDGFEQESGGVVLEIADDRRRDLRRGQGRARLQARGDLRAPALLSRRHRQGGLGVRAEAARPQEPRRQAEGR